MFVIKGFIIMVKVVNKFVLLREELYRWFNKFKLGKILRWV